MKLSNRVAVISLLMAVGMVLGTLQGAAGSQVYAAPVPQETAVSHGLRPDAPTYGVRGSFPVGARDFVIQGGDEPVYITVWYPALNLEHAAEAIVYTINEEHPDLPGLTITGQALQDAAPDGSGGPYPLVVYAGGLAGWRQMSAYIAEHLASYGFVVIASDPRGETFESFWAGAATRPLDTQRIITYADELAAADGELAGLIDTETIAVAGHSSGGLSALLGGGAQFDFGWCAAHPDRVAQNALNDCNQFVPHQAEIAEMLGLTSAPGGMWPPQYDPRVDAVIAMAPDGEIWGAEYQGVAAIKAPTLVMTGSGDTVVIPEDAAYPVYEHLGSAKKSLVRLENADHFVFLNSCRNAPWFVEIDYRACSDPVWDIDRAHDLINHFATAFLLAELKGDIEAAQALTPENVAFPGIRYETTAYTNTEVNKALMEQVLDVWNAGDWEKLVTMVSPDFVDHITPTGAPGTLNDFLAASQAFQTEAPNVECIVSDMFAEGERVVAMATCTGTVAESGQPLRDDVILIYRFVDGKLTDRWAAIQPVE